MSIGNYRYLGRILQMMMLLIIQDFCGTSFHLGNNIIDCWCCYRRLAIRWRTISFTTSQESPVWGLPPDWGLPLTPPGSTSLGSRRSSRQKSPYLDAESTTSWRPSGVHLHVASAASWRTSGVHLHAAWRQQWRHARLVFFAGVAHEFILLEPVYRGSTVSIFSNVHLFWLVSPLFTY